MEIDFLENFDKEVKTIFYPFIQNYGFELFEKKFRSIGPGSYDITYKKENLLLILSISLHPHDYFDGISIQFKTWKYNLDLTYLRNLTKSKRIYTFNSKGLNEVKEDLVEFANFYLTQLGDKELEAIVKQKDRKWLFW